MEALFSFLAFILKTFTIIKKYCKILFVIFCNFFHVEVYLYGTQFLYSC